MSVVSATGSWISGRLPSSAPGVPTSSTAPVSPRTTSGSGWPAEAARRSIRSPTRRARTQATVHVPFGVPCRTRTALAVRSTSAGSDVCMAAARTA